MTQEYNKIEKKFNVSRTTLWRYMKINENYGYEIINYRGKNYFGRKGRKIRSIAQLHLLPIMAEFLMATRLILMHLHIAKK